MQPRVLYKTLNIVVVIAVTMFFSCNNNLKKVNKIGVSENEPIGESININLKYTDSGRVKSDEDNKRSNILADYAIIYNQTNLIDLQGHVKLITSDNDTLFAEQLYYDNNKGWIFTNRPVTYRTGFDLIHGNGFDSNSKFTNAEVLEVTGIVTLNE